MKSPRKSRSHGESAELITAKVEIRRRKTNASSVAAKNSKRSTFGLSASASDSVRFWICMGSWKRLRHSTDDRQLRHDRPQTTPVRSKNVRNYVSFDDGTISKCATYW